MEYRFFIDDDCNEYDDLMTEYKGWFSSASVEINDGIIDLVFYDLISLEQNVKACMLSNDIYYKENLIIVETVNLANMKKAVEYLYRTGKLQNMIKRKPE